MKTDFIPLTSKLGFNSDMIPYYGGMQDCAPGWSYGPGMKDHYLIHYVKSGKGKLIVNQKTHTIGSGSVFLLSPYEVTFYEADFTDPWSYSWIGFSGMNAAAYVKETGLSKEQPVLIYPDNETLNSHLTKMAEAFHSNICTNLKVTGLLYGFLAELIELNYTAIGAHEDESTKELYVRKAVEFIYMNYSRTISIVDIAKYIGIGRKYLHRLFREQAGFSPQAFLIHFRMQKACELLRNETILVSEIANSVGYADPLNFSRLFRKVMGTSPQSYRKSLLNRPD